METPHENPAFIGDDGKSVNGQSRALRYSDEEEVGTNIFVRLKVKIKSLLTMSK